MYGINFYADTAALSLATFFDTIDRTFFTPNFGTYENLSFFNDPTMFRLIIFGLYFGIIAAALFMFYTKRVLGAFVRALDKNGALSKENAKTLSELGFEKNIFVKLALITGYTLRHVVYFVPAPADETEENAKKKAKKLKKGAPDASSGGNLAELGVYGYRADLSRDAFYIPEEKKYTADIRFDSKGANIGTAVIVIIVSLVICALICHFLPDLIKMVDNFISITKGN